jgi:hypothetical protein
MEIIIGGIFLAVLAFGFILWLGSAIQAAQTQETLAPARQKSEYGSARTVKTTPRQRETAAKVKASDRAIATERRKAIKGTLKGTVYVEQLHKAVDYEGRKVNGMCLDAHGQVTGYIDLATVPLDWE